MTELFPGIGKIQFEGPQSRNPLAFKHYNAQETVLGKTMAEHLRFAVCYWHTFKGSGADMFGAGTFNRAYNESSDPLTVAEKAL
jgi:xylose isomerase